MTSDVVDPSDVSTWQNLTGRRDLADVCRFLMENYSDDMHINVGTGVDLSIRELAEKIRGVVNPQAELVGDRTKPDGTPRKVLDVTRVRIPNVWLLFAARAAGSIPEVARPPSVDFLTTAPRGVRVVAPMVSLRCSTVERALFDPAPRCS